MTLAAQISALASRVALEFKEVRSDIAAVATGPGISNDYVLTLDGTGATPQTQVGGVIVLPTSPFAGQSLSVLADSQTTLPIGVTWDTGGPPTLPGGQRRMIGFMWSGTDWVGTYSPLIMESYSTLSEAIMALAPVGYWKLDETSGTQATDSSGNGRHGTYSGTYTLNARDGAPAFAGGIVSIPDDDVFTIGASGLTVFGIGYITADSETSSLYAMKGGDGGYEWSLGVGWDSFGRPSQASWWAPAGADWQADYIPGAHPKNEWVALAAPIGVPATMGGRIPMYRNSGTPTETTQMSPLSDIPPLSGSGGTEPVRLADGAFQGFFNGSLRHVAIFGTALSGAQIGMLMNAAITEGLIL